MKTNLFVAASMFVIMTAGCKKIKLNKVPIADAGPAQTIQLQTDSVTLSGNGTDEDGTIMGYLWSKIAGPNIPAIHTPGAVTTRVTGMIAGVYRFQLMVVDDDGATGLDTVSVTILTAQLTTVTMQPGTDGQDALVITKDGDNTSPNLNIGQHTELVYSKWTYGGQGFGEGAMRSYIKFASVSSIPASAEILSAKLSLYGVASSGFTPEGNSHFPGSPYGSGPDNPGWVKRVTSNWEEATITWNNKPGTVDAGQASIPGTTTQWNFNATDIDVTDMVRAMVSTNSNYGFCLTLQNEAIYRNVIFASSEATDAARRPKLVVVYR